MQPDTLVVEAPPSIRRRLASMLYEALLLLGVLSITFVVPYVGMGMLLKTIPPGPVLLLHIFVVLGCYFLWYWRRSGQTLAMQTWKLQLEASAGAPLGWWRLCLRYALAWPSILFYGAGIFWALFDRDRQFLHDRLAGTRIVFRR